jgi:hypothetical protein
MMSPARVNPTPWHREPWPWLLMAAPLMSIIGGIAILFISLASNDGLVADDYYKQGLAINQQLTREQAATAGHYRAHVLFTPALDRVRITFAGDGRPDVLVMRFNHATRAGFDRVVFLKRTSEDTYEAGLPSLATGRWHVAIEDDRSSWRLTGEWQAPQELSLSFPVRPKEGR